MTVIYLPHGRIEGTTAIRLARQQLFENLETLLYALEREDSEEEHTRAEIAEAVRVLRDMVRPGA